MIQPEDITPRRTDSESALSVGDSGQYDEEIHETEPDPATGKPTLRRTVLRNPGQLCTRGAMFITTYLRARRDREWQFPRGLFSDPAWDILLHLYAAQSEGRQVSMWDACQAAAVPEASGKRWLRILESRHLVERQDDKNGQDQEWVLLTHDAIAGMNRWLDRMAPLPAGDPQGS